jgi:hypothetical protein
MLVTMVRFLLQKGKRFVGQRFFQLAMTASGKSSSLPVNANLVMAAGANPPRRLRVTVGGMGTFESVTLSIKAVRELYVIPMRV